MNDLQQTLPPLELGDESHAEYLGRWFAMRQYAIEIGILSERVLAQAGALNLHKRRFISHEEWANLTKG